MNIRYILVFALSVLVLAVVLMPKAQAQQAYVELVLSPMECIQYASVARKLAQHRDEGRSSGEFAFPNDSYLSLHEYFKFVIYKPDQKQFTPEQFEREFYLLCMSEPVGYLSIPKLYGG